MTSLSGHAQDHRVEALSDYRVKNRVLLVFAASEKDFSYQQQTKLWHDAKAGFAERQLIVLPVLSDGKPATADTSGALAQRFGVDAKSFKVVLIGKDGHDAFRSDRPVTAQAIYECIDAMLMRRAEMKRQQTKGQDR